MFAERKTTSHSLSRYFNDLSEVKALLLFKKISSDAIPMRLLLEADPSEKRVTEYLKEAECFGAWIDNQLSGACVTHGVDEITVEIANISIFPGEQRNGIGTKLLAYVIESLADKDVKRVVLGTGAFGHQLTFYQRLGFRVDSIIKDFFLDNYNDPIYESGIQHKDMLRLALNLT